MTTDEPELYKKHGWSVVIDERTGALRIISTTLRKRLVLLPRDGNSVTLMQVDRSVVEPETPR